MAKKTEYRIYEYDKSGHIDNILDSQDIYDYDTTVNYADLLQVNDTQGYTYLVKEVK